jgi:hypothetical protein
MSVDEPHFTRMIELLKEQGRLPSEEQFFLALEQAVATVILREYSDDSSES